MYQTIKTIATLTIVAALSACGGGGGSADDGGATEAVPVSTPGEAQGVYTGSFSSQAHPAGRFSTLVLDNDEMWTLYGNEGENGALIVFGVLQGAGASSSGSFSAPSVREFYFNGARTTGAMTATYRAGETFNGLLSANGQSVGFAGVVPTAGATNYNYNAPAQISDISGSWSGTNLEGFASDFTIASTGTFSGVNELGCGFSGYVTPRPSGKSVFDVTLTNNTSPECGAASGLLGRGIAVTSVLASGMRQLIVAIVSNDRVNGGAIFATR